MERLAIKSTGHPVECLFTVGHDDLKGLSQSKRFWDSFLSVIVIIENLFPRGLHENILKWVELLMFK